MEKDKIKQCCPTGVALQHCRLRGYSVTRQGLCYIGMRYNIMFWDDKHWHFDKAKLDNYITDAKQPVPKGYITVKQAAEVIGKSISFVYSWLDSGRLKSKKIGAGRGMQYVSESDIKKINDEHSGNNK